PKGELRTRLGSLSEEDAARFDQNAGRCSSEREFVGVDPVRRPYPYGRTADRRRHGELREKLREGVEQHPSACPKRRVEAANECFVIALRNEARRRVS